jgi:hypothetical protein
MVSISLNIGSEGRSLNTYPIFFQCETFREFSNLIRRDSFHLADWAHVNHVPKSMLYLYIHVDEGDWEWDFSIKCSRIREYKQYMIGYEKFDLLKIKMERDSKISDILNKEENL